MSCPPNSIEPAMGIYGEQSACLLLPKTILWLPSRGGKKHRFSASREINTRLSQWDGNNISHLWEVATSQAKSPRPSTSSNNLQRALFKGREGHYGKAIQALQSQGIASPNNVSALIDLIHRHPQSPLPPHQANFPPPLSTSPKMVRATLQSFPKDSSPGGSGLRIQHLIDLASNSAIPASWDCLNSLTRWLNHLLSGKANPALAPWICGAPLTALHKKGNKGFRPIAVGEIYRRLASKLCCSFARSDLPSLFVPYGQLGVGIPGGLEATIHSVRHLIDQHQLVEHMCLLKVDFLNAFNECHRPTILSQVETHFPELYGWTQWSYSSANRLHFGPNQLLSTTGVQQGDPLGPLLFSLALCKMMDEIQFIAPTTNHFWYLDDGTIVGPRSEVAELYQKISTAGPKYGLTLNPQKCELFWPTGDQTFPEFDNNIQRLSEGVSLLGSPLWGSDTFFANHVHQLVQNTKSLHALIPDLQDPQVELHLLRSCLGSCRVNHILRSVPPGPILPQLQEFDKSLRSTLSEVLHCSIPNQAWTQATLPLSMGGLGLRQASRSASAAFVACCAMSRPLAQEVLSIEQDLAFPGESHATQDLLINHSINLDAQPLDPTSQSSLQHQLDKRLYGNLFSTSDLRNQARLNTLSADTITSAWLKAAPISSLGLAMAGPEFISATRYWLGIPHIPPSTPLLCPCSNHIDPYGDHIIGCAHGPYRIRRHDALRNTIFHTLREDNPNVLLEQRVSGDSGTRPGDIYHPDFDNGRAYLL